MNQNLFDASFFAGNRKRLRSLLDTDIVVLTGSARLQRSGDTTFPFRQDSNFWYFTGINEPECVLVIDTLNDDEYIILPKQSSYDAVFNGVNDGNEMKLESGVTVFEDYEAGWKKLGERIKGKKVGTLLPPPAYIEDHRFYTNPARYMLTKALQQTGGELVDVREQCLQLRMVKQPAEITALKLAIDATNKTLKEDVVSVISSAISEHELMARITYGFDRRGATGHGYEPIVAAGKNACVLHYVENSAPLADNQMILIDVGAEMTMYSADITRTYPRNSTNARHLEVYTAVYDVQQKVISGVRPGTTIRDIDNLARLAMVEALRGLGLSAPSDDELLNKYYPHSIGHYIGLDVHDAGDYKAPLQPGMVLTIEPGIYIPEESIGIRIEDDVLVTQAGHEVLSADLPSDPSSVFGL